MDLDFDNIVRILMMVIVGGLSGSLASFIIRGNNFGLVVNVVLGIFGAVVGGAIFNFLGLTPGAGIVKIISQTFDVKLPPNFVGMIVSATIGSMLILLGLRFIQKRR